MYLTGGCRTCIPPRQLRRDLEEVSLRKPTMPLWAMLADAMLCACRRGALAGMMPPPAPHDLQPFLASGEVPKVRRNMHAANHALGWQVGLLCLAACGLLTTAAGAQAPAAVPVFQVTPGDSTVTFHVNASVTIDGTF